MFQEKKRQERIELERLLELEMLEQAQLASQAVEEKQRFIEAMAQVSIVGQGH